MHSRDAGSSAAEPSDASVSMNSVDLVIDLCGQKKVQAQHYPSALDPQKSESSPLAEKVGGDGKASFLV